MCISRTINKKEKQNKYFWNSVWENWILRISLETWDVQQKNSLLFKLENVAVTVIRTSFRVVVKNYQLRPRHGNVYPQNNEIKPCYFLRNQNSSKAQVWSPKIKSGIYVCMRTHIGLLRKRSVKESACRCGRGKRSKFDLWVRKTTWRKIWQATPVFLPGKFHGRGHGWVIAHGVKRVGHNWAHKKRYTHTHTHTHTHENEQKGKK